MSRQTQWLAKLAPLDQDLVVHDEHGLTRERWTSGAFPAAMKDPSSVRVLVAHDPTLEVGRLDIVYERDGWICCAFRLRDDPAGQAAAETINVGTAMSIGAKIRRLAGRDFPYLEEVSLVPSGAYRGAEVTGRVSLPWSPLPTWPPTARATETTVPSPTPSPRAPSNRGGEVLKQPASTGATATHLHRGRPVSDSAWKQELERRLDWLEAATGRPADTEAVVRGLRREIDGPTADELYAETIGRSRMAV